MLKDKNPIMNAIYGKRRDYYLPGDFGMQNKDKRLKNIGSFGFRKLNNNLKKNEKTQTQKSN